MQKKNLLMSVLAGTLILNVGAAWADDKERDRDKAREQTQTKEQDKTKEQSQDRERIYGSQLMTNQERVEYRSKMRAAKTKQERKQIREEHHKLMKERAKERGVTLPDEPPEKGGMMGPGGMMEPGSGMRPAGGMGPGGGRNR